MYRGRSWDCKYWKVIGPVSGCVLDWLSMGWKVTSRCIGTEIVLLIHGVWVSSNQPIIRTYISLSFYWRHSDLCWALRSPVSCCKHIDQSKPWSWRISLHDKKDLNGVSTSSVYHLLHCSWSLSIAAPTPLEPPCWSMSWRAAIFSSFALPMSFNWSQPSKAK